MLGSHEGECVTSLVIPLCFVADSVARYQMLNRQLYHAFYGCLFVISRVSSKEEVNVMC